MRTFHVQPVQEITVTPTERSPGLTGTLQLTGEPPVPVMHPAALSACTGTNAQITSAESFHASIQVFKLLGEERRTAAKCMADASSMCTRMRVCACVFDVCSDHLSSSVVTHLSLLSLCSGLKGGGVFLFFFIIIILGWWW